ncbi:MAG: hypothetical protein JO199_09995 [Candidatus Eremiobacteraeota bacterium]|nr:hypothetical protein [Candidatus Eremiobacteraeota bacterium]
MRVCRASVIACCLLMLAACSAFGVSPEPGNGSKSFAVPAEQRRHPKTAHVHLSVKVPRHRRGARFVSPATASLQYTIDSGSPANVDISLSNPKCHPNGTGLQCNVSILTTVGDHTFSFTTYDGSNGSGNVLSADTQVTYNVKYASANQIPVVLGGVAVGFAVFPPVSRAVRGLQDAGFTIYGSAPQTFRIVPVDADDNLIVGPGSPTPVVAATPASMAMTTPKPTSPNAWTLTSTYAATNPTVPAAATLFVSATPVPYSGGKTVSASIPLTLYQPWIYVADFGYSQSPSGAIASGVIHTYDEQGNVVTPSDNAPFCPVCQINSTAILYDQFDELLYIGRGYEDTVSAWSVEGTPQTAINNTGFGPNPGLHGPNGITLDPSAGVVYVGNFGGGYLSTFNEVGAQIGTITASGNMIHPMGLAYANGNVYEVDQGEFSLTPRINVFTGGVYQTAITGGISSTANKISFDGDDGLLFLANGTAGDDLAFDATTNQPVTLGSCFANLSNANAVLYDPYDGLVYASAAVYSQSSSTGSISVCDPAGNKHKVGGSFAGLMSPQAIEVVP